MNPDAAHLGLTLPTGQPPRFYLAGYQGKTLAELRAQVIHLNAQVVDIRMSPRSRVPEWNKRRISEALHDRYLHLRALGNVNYNNREKGIELAFGHDIALGLLCTAQRDCILLCQCKDGASCHRAVVGRMLRDRGMQVQELTWTI